MKLEITGTPEECRYLYQIVISEILFEMGEDNEKMLLGFLRQLSDQLGYCGDYWTDGNSHAICELEKEHASGHKGEDGSRWPK